MSCQRLKWKYAKGSAPASPVSLLEAEDRYQASLSWPAEPTAEEQPLLDELREAVAPALEGLACAEWPDVTGSLRLLRFLRGFEFHVPSAAVAFRRMLDVRKEYGMDASHEKALAMLAAVGPAGDYLPTAKSAEIHKNLPWIRAGVAKTDARGIGPVNYLPLARLNYDGFYADGCDACFFEHHTVSQQANAQELYALSVERGLSTRRGARTTKIP